MSMANNMVSIVLYSGGLIIDGNEGCDYSCPPRHFLRVPRNINLRALLTKIHSKINIDPTRLVTRLICRYPISHTQSGHKFIQVPVEDDENLGNMLDIPSYFPTVHAVEFYVLCDAFNPEPSFTELLGGQSSGGGGFIPSQCGGGGFTNLDDGNFFTQSTLLSQTTMDGSSSQPPPPFVTPELNWNRFIRAEENIHCTTEWGRWPVEEERPIINEYHGDVYHGDEDHGDEIESHETLYYSDDSDHEPDLSPRKLDLSPRKDDGYAVPFLNDIGNEKYHKYDQLNDHDRPFWVDNPPTKLKKCMVFRTKDDLQHAVRITCIREGKTFKVAKSDKTTWHVRCENHDQQFCPWSVWGKKKAHGYFEITKLYPDHSCLSGVNRNDHANLDSKTISRLVRTNVEENVAYMPRDVQADMRQIGVTVSYKKAWLGKNKAKESVYGNWQTSYSVLPRYLLAVMRQNQGTIVKWKHDQSPEGNSRIFNSVFWAFFPSIEGFKHCRPVITIDGTHQYGMYKEKILIACGIDADGHIFPLAFAITDEENLVNWSWFLANLVEHVICGRRGVCIISDRHGGIMGAFRRMPELQPPLVYHRFCLRHVMENFSKAFKNSALLELFVRAARANQVRKFNYCMQSIKDLNEAAWKWAADLPQEKWTLCYDGGVRFGIMTTNRSESFNSVLKGARKLPITACVRSTFLRLNAWFNKNGGVAEKYVTNNDRWTIDPVARYVRNQNKSQYHRCTRYNATTALYEVVTGSHSGRGNNVHTVCLGERTCTCGKFQNYKIPCSHAFAACNHMQMNSIDLVDIHYTPSKMLATYSCKFVPVLHEDYWPHSPFHLVPNESRFNAQRGRPRETRFGNEMDTSRMQQCRVCWGYGHRKKSCPLVIALRHEPHGAES